jgi:Na+-translocating ferredoxin:NAD+ oxidoreductase RnfG subunit
LEWGLRSNRSALLLSVLLSAGLAGAAGAGVYHSQQEALELAFPDADRVEKKNHILEDAEVEAIEGLARSKLESRLVSLYTGWRGDAPLGYAVIDIHTVRTQPEAFIVVISPDGRVRSLRVLAFYEPQEYLPSERWLHQFDDKPLSDRLHLRADIHGIAGSTLSARAVTSAVRRALAFYEILVAPEPGAKPGDTPASGL